MPNVGPTTIDFESNPPKPPKYAELDWNAIRDLDIRRVARELGCEPDPANPSRWRFEDERCGKLAFEQGGNAFYHHKTEIGGGPIELTALSMRSDKNDSQAFSGDETLAAAQWLAERYNLEVSYTAVHARSRALATAKAAVNDNTEALASLTSSLTVPEVKATIDGLLTDTSDPRHRELRRYCDATGLTIRELSIAPYGDSYCILPAAPILGERYLTKPVPNPDPRFPLTAPVNKTWGGWSKSRVEEALQRSPHAGRLYIVDFDGVKGASGQTLYPRIALIKRLTSDLRKRGLPPAALEVTTPDLDDDTRGKMHVTFVASERAATSAEVKRRHALIETHIQAVLASWNNVSSEELNCLKRDKAMQQPSRLKRLAGCAKRGKQNAVTVLESDPNARVDFTDLLECQNAVVVAGDVEYELGAKCMKREFKRKKADDGTVVRELVRTIPLARELWPIALTVDETTGASGLRYRYKTRQGRTRYASICASAWVSQRAPQAITDEMGTSGVQIEPGRAGDLVKALGQWATTMPNLPTLNRVTRSGWYDHDRVFVNGAQVLGADWMVEGDHKKYRGQRSGNIEDWRNFVEREATSPGLIIALGIGFAGPLLKPLRRKPFGVHISGRSSSGKSKSSRLAASIWGNPEEVCQSWSGTDNGFETQFEHATGGLMILDEVQLAKSKVVHKVGYTFGDGYGKTRQQRGANALRFANHWSCTLLSTGENTIRDWVGRNAQGGLTVRLIDLPVESGDLTTDADHATRLELGTRDAHGTAWKPFCQVIMEEPVTELRGRYDEVVKGLCDRYLTNKSDGEGRRILEQIAVVELALHIARKAKVMPPNLSIDRVREAIEWMVNAIFNARGGLTSPEARAFEVLRSEVGSNPSDFPAIDDVKSSKSNSLGGIVSDDRTTLFTRPKLKKLEEICKDAGCTSKSLLGWLVEEGGATKPEKNSRVGGIQGRWYKITLNDGEVVDEGDDVRWKPSTSDLFD